jgi:hypothetical protein
LPAADPPAEIGDIHREVSASPAEYGHALRGAFPATLTGGPLLYRAERDGVTLEIEITPAPPRKIALLVLPVSHIRLRFLSGDPAARARVLRHMDLAMRRGGG